MDKKNLLTKAMKNGFEWYRTREVDKFWGYYTAIIIHYKKRGKLKKKKFEIKYLSVEKHGYHICSPNREEVKEFSEYLEKILKQNLAAKMVICYMGNRRRIEACIQEHTEILVEVVDLQDLEESQLEEICKKHCHPETCPHFKNGKETHK
jgi:hypothetical protein